MWVEAQIYGLCTLFVNNLDTSDSFTSFTWSHITNKPQVSLFRISFVALWDIVYRILLNRIIYEYCTSAHLCSRLQFGSQRTFIYFFVPVLFFSLFRVSGWIVKHDRFDGSSFTPTFVQINHIYKTVRFMYIIICFPKENKGTIVFHIT